MEADQEELVSMIFGDNPPENWRENPEFSLYLAEMGNMGVERISGEGERVASQLKTLQQQTQDLASDNYKTFIQTSNCTAEIYKEFATTEQHLAEVLDQLGHFRTDCSEFQTISQVGCSCSSMLLVKKSVVILFLGYFQAQTADESDPG